MSTTQQSTVGRWTPTARVDVRPAACGCGQDLDGAPGSHCPRCGCQLGAARIEPDGLWFAA